MDKKELEKLSSAITLSDMEIFVFPELMYALLLANIMSPVIWEWRKDPWFKKIDKMSPYKKVQRLKQYIMDNFVFNLDLETWGLTTQEKELKRFELIIDTKALKKSNALFGYEGDKYYFDVNIRKHFGLDKYNSNVIPYWKTETVEAMAAFKYKDTYTTGAGECVSLAALYAAALFIVTKIPLEDIYLMATPLHSQNFIDIRDGILTNNRRLVTKNMWVNGTELSAKARRALDKEKVTIVCHKTGHIHILYKEATIDKETYIKFREKLTKFTQAELTPEILGNFIRHERELQKCFQVKWESHNHIYYIEAEKIFLYEQSSPYFFNSPNRERFMSEIDADDLHSSPLEGRIVFNDWEDYLKRNRIDLNNKDDVKRLREHFSNNCINSEKAINAIIDFCMVTPKFPDYNTKNFVKKNILEINTEMSRSEITDYLLNMRNKNETANLAFYAYRDINRTDYRPFLYAAINRNPVSIEGTKNLSTAAEIYALLDKFGENSIYEGESRLAQPDEVWNYKRGDGLEKAILLANIINSRSPLSHIEIKPRDAVLVCKDRKTFVFKTSKNVKPGIWKIENLLSY